MKKILIVLAIVFVGLQANAQRGGGHGGGGFHGGGFHGGYGGGFHGGFYGRGFEHVYSPFYRPYYPWGFGLGLGLGLAYPYYGYGYYPYNYGYYDGPYAPGYVPDSQPAPNSSDEGGTMQQQPPASNYTAPAKVYRAISRDELDQALASLRHKDNDETKTIIAKQIIDNNYFFTWQVKELMNRFKDDAGKLQVAEYAYNRCLDRRNYYMLNSQFKDQANVPALDSYMKAGK